MENWPFSIFLLFQRKNLPFLNKRQAFGLKYCPCPLEKYLETKILVTYRSKKTGTLSASDLIIRCGEYDLTSSEVERYQHQERNVETFTVHPYFR